MGLGETMFENTKLPKIPARDAMFVLGMMILGASGGQMAAFGLMGAIVGAAVGLGVVTIVLVLMPAVAGQVISALNDTAVNDPYFHSVVAGVPTTMGSDFTLLGIAALVVIVAIIVGTLGGLFVGNRMG